MQVKQPAPRLDEVVPGTPWCTPQLIALVACALAKQPDERFASAPAMISVLDTAFGSLDHIV